MKELVLLYHMTDTFRRARVQNALLSIGIPCKVVEKKDYLKPIGMLVGEKMPFVVVREYEGEELADTMLVLAGLSSARVDQVLKVFREFGVGSIPYKAVLTDTNQYWTSLMLFEELKREHQAMHKK